jgi:hypothetical protein
VIAPAWLRERVADDLRRGAQIYDTESKIPHVSEVR